MNAVARHWPLIATLAVLFAAVGILYGISVSQNGGQLVYALDDAYIHMAMARSFAEHGVWGVTRHEFSSSSSSPLWTLLLSGVYRLFGTGEAAPLLLNALMAGAVLAVVYWILRRHIPDKPGVVAAILAAVLVGTPLVPLAFAGMEHTLQVLVSIAMVYAAGVVLSAEGDGPGRSQARRFETLLLVLAPLVTAARYEGMFLIGLVCLLLVMRRRIVLAAGVALLAALPIVVYGVISVGHGWHFFPNSIVLKGQTSSLHSVRGAVRFLLTWNDESRLTIPRVVCLTGAAATVYLLWRARRRGPWSLQKVVMSLFVATLLLHIPLAKIGWFYRYEAYLAAMFVLAAGLYLVKGLQGRSAGEGIARLRQRQGAALGVYVAAMLIVGRGALAIKETPEAMNDRYCEHVSIARFVREHYNDAVVMVNDIGAVAWYSDARILDLYGLASEEPVALRRKPGGYTARDVREWAAKRGAKIAILQVEWVEVAPRIPKEWIEVGQWVLSRNVVFGDTHIGFYGVDPPACSTLASDLRQFADKVPHQVGQTGLYAAGMARGVNLPLPERAGRP